jgi:CxxC motif-containing protein (DUF1111 family)
VNSDLDKDALPEKSLLPEKVGMETRPQFGASAREWRTPPLWGVRDSAPYLHDGRADTLADAILMHRGEGLRSAHMFDSLTPREQLQIELFLQSLAAPGSVK